MSQVALLKEHFGILNLGLIHPSHYHLDPGRGEHRVHSISIDMIVINMHPQWSASSWEWSRPWGHIQSQAGPHLDKVLILRVRWSLPGVFLLSACTPEGHGDIIQVCLSTTHRRTDQVLLFWSSRPGTGTARLRPAVRRSFKRFLCAASILNKL